jgi:thioesterase domain-containing protein
MKPGPASRRLFIFPGAGSDLREVAPLAARVAPSWSVVGVECWWSADPLVAQPTEVSHMAGVAYAAIKAMQPRGPYHLSGYSFGGLVAYEVANLFLSRGDQVELLALIDCQFDRRFWPSRQRAGRRRNHLERFGQMSNKERYLKARGVAGRLARQLLWRLRRGETGPIAPLWRCMGAYAAYNPPAYGGHVVLFGPDRTHELGLDFAELWTGYAASIEIIRVPGGHLELMRSRQQVRYLAQAINQTLSRLPVTRPWRRPR